MSHDLYLMLAIFTMAGITFITRVTPTILPKKLLTAPFFVKLNQALPLTVMVLLILSALSWQDNNPPNSPHFALSALLVAQILSLVVVLVSYHVFRQLLVSMIIGIACLNGFLYVLQNLGWQ